MTRIRTPTWLRTPETAAVAGYGELIESATRAERERRESLRALALSLPWPPSVNRYWRHVPAKRGGVKVLVSEEGRAYRRAVAQHVAIRTASMAGKAFPAAARLGVHVDAYPPDKVRRDLDNLLKSLLDALEKARLYADDSAIDDLRIVRRERRDRGEVVVRLAVLEGG